MSSSPLPLALTAALATAAVAQGPEEAQFAALDEQIAYGLDDRGRTTIAPDPMGGDGAVPLVASLGHAFMNIGLFGWLSLIAPGDTDLASLADADAHFARLGVEGDELLRLVTRPPQDGDAPHVALRRLLAVRAVAARREQAALAPLHGMVAEPPADPVLARAAAEAEIELLDGTAAAGPAAAVTPLAEALERVPGRAAIVARIDQTRLPAARTVIALGRITGIEVTKAAIRAAGGAVTPMTWAGARALCEGLGELPYELARQFGNGRVYRTVVAVVLGSSPEDAPALWLRHDGTFDRERVRRGLVAAGHEASYTDGVLLAAWRDGDLELRIADGFLEVRMDEAGPAADPQRRARIAAAVAGDAPVVVAVLDRSALVGPALEALPERAELWVPRGRAEMLRARVTAAGAEAAARLAADYRAGTAAVSAFAAELGALRPLADRMAEAELAVDGAVVSLALDPHALDLAAMLRTAIREGLLR